MGEVTSPSPGYNFPPKPQVLSCQNIPSSIGSIGGIKVSGGKDMQWTVALLTYRLFLLLKSNTHPLLHNGGVHGLHTQN